jgi:hypothetical protein
MKLLFSIVLVFAMSAFAQQPPSPTVEAQSSGECSPNILANQGKVEFTCNTSLDKDTAKKLASLLSQLLRKEGSSANTVEEINHKVDELLDFVKKRTPVPRRLPPQTKTELIDCLKKKPGQFSVEAIADNGEAYQYAEDWREVFLSAGWEDEHKNIPIQVFMIGGGTWSGIQFKVHDASSVQGQIAVAEGSPEQGMGKCLMDRSDVPGGARIIPYRDLPGSSVDIEVSYQPQPR